RVKEIDHLLTYHFILHQENLAAKFDESFRSVMKKYDDDDIYHTHNFPCFQHLIEEYSEEEINLQPFIELLTVLHHDFSASSKSLDSELEVRKIVIYTT
ncbi:hypothetical protein L9F63_008154, partial [Diploptera punctata]